MKIDDGWIRTLVLSVSSIYSATNPGPDLILKNEHIFRLTPQASMSWGGF